MDIIGIAIWIVVLLTAVALVMWFVRYEGITIPQPVRIVLAAVFVIVCLILLSRFAGGVGRV